MKNLEYPSYYTHPMILAYVVREDIAKKIPQNISTTEKQKYFAMWWLEHGGIEYPNSFELTSDLISIANEVVKTAYGYSINRFMYYVLQTREDLKRLYSIDTLLETQKFIAWYYIHGLKEYQLTGLLTDEEKSRLTNPYRESEKLDTSYFKITQLMYLVWLHREDLQNITSLQTPDEKNWFVKWFYIHGCKELGLSHCLSTEKISKLNQYVQV